MVVVASYKAGMTLAECLKQRRAELGQPTQAAMGKQMGVDQSQVGRWLNGKLVPSADRADAIANWLDVPVGRVLALIADAQRSEARATAVHEAVHALKPVATLTFESLERRVAELEARVNQLEAGSAALPLAAQGDPEGAARALDPKRRRKRPSPKAPSE